MTTNDRWQRREAAGATAKPVGATNETNLPESLPGTCHDAPQHGPQDDPKDVIVTLRDGVQVVIRPLRPRDAQRLAAFHASLSRATLVARFLHSVPAVSLAQAERLARVDGDRAMAFVATAGPGLDAPILAEGLYRRIDPAPCDEAEIALVVADAWQGRGLGGILFQHLSAYARAHGIQIFVADTFATNLRVVRMIRQAGIPVRARVACGEVQLRLDISVRRCAVKRQ